MALRLLRALTATLLTVFVVAVVLGSMAVNAATVSMQSGNVLVSKGEQGFVPITGAVELAPGGRIMVQPGGLATISYATGCTVRVGSGFWVVQEKAPCAAGTSEIDFATRMNQQAPPTATGLTPEQEALLIGGGIAAIAGGVLWSFQNNNNNKPVSP